HPALLRVPIRLLASGAHTGANQFWFIPRHIVIGRLQKWARRISDPFLREEGNSAVLSNLRSGADRLRRHRRVQSGRNIASETQGEVRYLSQSRIYFDEVSAFSLRLQHEIKTVQAA